MLKEINIFFSSFSFFFVFVCFAILEHFESLHLMTKKKMNMEQTTEKIYIYLKFYMIFHSHYTIFLRKRNLRFVRHRH